MSEIIEDYLSYKSLSDDDDADHTIDDFNDDSDNDDDETEAELINSMREVVTNELTPRKETTEDKELLPEPPTEIPHQKIGFSAERYFYKEDEKDEQVVSEQETSRRSLEDLIPIIREASRPARDREQKAKALRKQSPPRDPTSSVSPSLPSLPMDLMEQISASNGTDLLPSKSRFAPVPKDSPVVLAQTSLPKTHTPELSGYSRPILLESNHDLISNDVYSPRVTVSLDSAFSQLQGQVSHMQQEMAKLLENKKGVREDKEFDSEVIQPSLAKAFVPHQSPVAKKVSRPSPQVIAPTTSTLSPPSAYSPAHMRMRMEQMSSHEQDAEEQIRSLKERIQKDENNLRAYEEENAMLKDKQRDMEENLRRIQAELDLERQVKLELQDSLLKQGRELKEVKASWQEASGELLSMRPDQKLREKELANATEKLRTTEKRSKDMERELKIMKKEMETMQIENRTSTAEILRLREQLDRIGDEKKKIEKDLKRAKMIPSPQGSNDVNRVRREYEEELKRREDRTRQLEFSLSSAQKEILGYENSLKKTREGASSEINRLRRDVSDLKTALQIAKSKQQTSSSSSSYVSKNESPPLHGSPPPWACDEGFDQYGGEAKTSSVSKKSMVVENIREPKRWATSSDLHWGSSSNREKELRKSSGRKHFEPRPDVVDDVLHTSSSSSVRRQLDMPSRTPSTTMATSKRGVVKELSTVHESPSAQRLAPFATDMSEKELKKRVSELEQSLMNFNLEKGRIKNKLMQFGVGAGRTMAQRRAKREMESRLNFLEETTSDIRMKLRYFELA